MTAPDPRLPTVLLVLLVSTIGVPGAVVAQPANVDNPVAQTQDETTQEQFVVRQGEECYEVEPVGHAWQSVSSFYEYDTRSSKGTRELQDNQVSNLLIFHGTEGYSLVVVHDEYGESEDASTVTMEFLGLPESGEWVVMDDNYDDRDDDVLHRGGRSKINWKWIGGRTDGGVFRGLNTTETLDIRINPRFNERADAWGDWEWSGDANNRTEAWRLYTDRDTTVELNMNQSVRVTDGTCDQRAPTAELSPSEPTIERNESVTLDAGRSSDDTGVVEYQWDLDGDGRVDRATNDSTITHEFERPGEYEVSVIVRDRAEHTDTASVTITVEDTGTESDPVEDAAAQRDERTEDTVASDERATDTGLLDFQDRDRGVLAGFAILLSTAILLSVAVFRRRR